MFYGIDKKMKETKSLDLKENNNKDKNLYKNEKCEENMINNNVDKIQVKKMKY